MTAPLSDIVIEKAKLTNWSQEVFNLDPQHTPIVLFSPELYVPQARRGSIDRAAEVTKIAFTWPNHIDYVHKHRRWIKTVYFPKRVKVNGIWGGYYNFNFLTDDGMRFFIDNELINVYQLNNLTEYADSWKVQDKTTYIRNQLFIEAGNHTIRVEHYNHTREGDAYFNISPEPETLVDVEEPPPPPPPPPSLKNVLRVTPSRIINLSYQLKSLMAPEPIELLLENTSPLFRIQVDMAAPDGVEFVPAVTHINPSGSTHVLVKFDADKLETLAAGLNRITNVFTVSSVSRDVTIPEDEPEPPISTDEIFRLSGNNQTVNAGQLFEDLIVRVIKDDGTPSVGTEVNWSVPNGAYHSLISPSKYTDVNGTSKAQLKSVEGTDSTITVKARLVSNDSYVLFTEIAKIPSLPSGSGEPTGSTGGTTLENPRRGQR